MQGNIVALKSLGFRNAKDIVDEKYPDLKLGPINKETFINVLKFEHNQSGFAL
jgi:hypothetical protein